MNSPVVMATSEPITQTYLGFYLFNFFFFLFFTENDRRFLVSAEEPDNKENEINYFLDLF